jgi:hypothetical protein
MLGFRRVGIYVVAIAAIGSGMLQQAMLAGAQETAEKPAWCKQLPRPEYAKLKRVLSRTRGSRSTRLRRMCLPSTSHTSPKRRSDT